MALYSGRRVPQVGSSLLFSHLISSHLPTIITLSFYLISPTHPRMRAHASLLTPPVDLEYIENAARALSRALCSALDLHARSSAKRNRGQRGAAAVPKLLLQQRRQMEGEERGRAGRWKGEGKEARVPASLINEAVGAVYAAHVDAPPVSPYAQALESSLLAGERLVFRLGCSLRASRPSLPPHLHKEACSVPGALYLTNYR